jgi:probable O-glycosylation ligase (exosortase A-associated)
VEALLLVMVLSAASLIITGGIKTILSGGGYGALVLLVSDNSGLYEGSTISCIAIAIVPLALWFTRHGTVYPPDWKVKLFCAGLVFACLLIPIGTQTRTGLLCIGALAMLMLRDSKRRLLYIAGVGSLALAAVPFLPDSYTSRMTTIQGYEADQSASTRLAVWAWTLDYVKERPFGGGFEAYIQNRVSVQTVSGSTSGSVERISASTSDQQGRAWHSAYFEMLGEQGFPGLALFLLIHAINIVRMERLRRRYRAAAQGDEWIAPLATALQHFQLIYLVGAAFIAVAFQPFVWMMLGAQIGFDRWVSRREAAGRRKPFAPPAMPAHAPA